MAGEGSGRDGREGGIGSREGKQGERVRKGEGGKEGRETKEEGREGEVWVKEKLKGGKRGMQGRRVHSTGIPPWPIHLHLPLSG